METKKTPSAFYARLVKIFKSRGTRNMIMFALLALSVLGMFMLDQDNWVRKEYLSFLNSNFISRFMVFFNIPRYNITIGAWLIFLCGLFVGLLWLVCNIFAPRFVNRMVESKRESFHTELGAVRFFTTVYYLVMLLVAAALIFMFYMRGGFKDFGANDAPLFLSLLYTLLICKSLGKQWLSFAHF